MFLISHVTPGIIYMIREFLITLFLYVSVTREFSDIQTLFWMTDIPWFKTIHYNFVSIVQLDYSIIDKFTHISMLITYISIVIQKYSDYNYKCWLHHFIIRTEDSCWYGGWLTSRWKYQLELWWPYHTTHQTQLPW